MSRLRDLTGQRFGRWFVQSRAPDLVSPSGRARSRWHCVCDCGGEAIVTSDNLNSGCSKSCGCLNIEAIRERSTDHGLSCTQVHNAWCSIRQRCENPENDSFARYGGRGIRVCETWQAFETFLADMGEPPTAKHTIERLDNDGDYEPRNCVWATRREQARNRSTNHVITIDRVSKSLIEWAEVSGTKRETIAARLRAGRTAAEAVWG